MMMRHMRVFVVSVLAAAIALASVAPAASAAELELASGTGFGDVSPSHVFAEPIVWLAQEGITRGCNPPRNDRFCPDDRVTRGQMAAFLVRAFGLEKGSAAFADTKGHVFAADVAALADAGITKGCNPPKNTKFCPDDYVTRGQMAAFLVRAFGLERGTAAFSDTKGHVFQADVAALADAGITKGCNPPKNTKFCPDDYVTRGQMAAFLYRAFGSPDVDLPDTSGGGNDYPVDQPTWKIRSYPKATYPESGGVCQIDFQAITPSGGAKIAADLERLVAGKMSFREFADRAADHGGPLTRWVASSPDWDHWVADFSRDFEASADQHPGWRKANALMLLTSAYHETVHDRQFTDFSLITGAGKGCEAPRNTGGPDDEWSAGPHKTRIASQARSILAKHFGGLDDFLEQNIQLYLEGDVGAQGMESLIWEMNAYALDGVLSSVVASGGRDATSSDAALQMFYAELWLIEVKRNFPDQWKKLRELGWDDVFAAAWAQAEGLWPQRSQDIEDMYHLVFGDYYHIVAEFTDGRVGTNPPPRP